ncbi:hypothetical protein BH20VER2_BH20VER2_12140 [soil metagenome]
MLIIALVFFALVLGGTWYLYGRVVNAVTSPTPITVQLEEPNEAQFTAANQKLRQIEAAAAAKEAVTVEFTADDLNALIARHPDYTDLRGKVRVAIADSIATLELSVPLRKVPLPRVKHRWFTGSASFGLTYDESGFTFSPRSIIANNYSIADDFFQGLAPTFNNYFNQEWDRSDRSETPHGDLWPQVRSVIVRDDKVVVTTKGRAATGAAPAATATPTPADEPALEPEE